MMGPMRTPGLLLIVALLLGSARGAELFNGRDLQGWRSFLVDAKAGDPRGVFSVTNGLIRISGDGLGYLRTENVYSNYHLILEYRWGSRNYAWGDRIGKARDSGLFLHATGPDGNSDDGGGAFMAAIECNIFQGATGDFLLIRGKDETGAPIYPRVTVNAAPRRDAEGWFTWAPNGEARTIERWGRVNWLNKDPAWQDKLDFRGTNDVEKPAPEWNTLEAICAGSAIEIRLNGAAINRATQAWPNAGRLLLQCEGSEIFIRRITLKYLQP